MLDLKKIKEKLCIPPDEFQKELNSWVFNDCANCYQYALSTKVDLLSAFNPGEISGISFPDGHMYSDEDLVYYMCLDVQTLGMKIRESTFEEIITDKNSWKIAVMNVRVISMSGGYDYHFLRQSRKTGEWSQKFRGDQHPTDMDAKHRIIRDPATASYEDFNYELVGYYVITKVEPVEP